VGGDSWLTSSLIDFVALHFARRYPDVHFLPTNFMFYEVGTAMSRYYASRGGYGGGASSPSTDGGSDGPCDVGYMPQDLLHRQVEIVPDAIPPVIIPWGEPALLAPQAPGQLARLVALNTAATGATSFGSGRTSGASTGASGGGGGGGRIHAPSPLQQTASLGPVYRPHVVRAPPPRHPAAVTHRSAPSLAGSTLPAAPTPVPSTPADAGVAATAAGGAAAAAAGVPPVAPSMQALVTEGWMRALAAQSGWTLQTAPTGRLMMLPPRAPPPPGSTVPGGFQLPYAILTGDDGRAVAMALPASMLAEAPAGTPPPLEPATGPELTLASPAAEVAPLPPAVTAAPLAAHESPAVRVPAPPPLLSSPTSSPRRPAGSAGGGLSAAVPSHYTPPVYASRNRPLIFFWNIGNMHWNLIRVHLGTRKEIEVFEPMGKLTSRSHVAYKSEGLSLRSVPSQLLAWLDHVCPLPTADGWKARTVSAITAKHQGNGFDCGVACLLYAEKCAQGMARVRRALELAGPGGRKGGDGGTGSGHRLPTHPPHTRHAQEDVMASTNQAQISAYRQLVARFFEAQRTRLWGQGGGGGGGGGSDHIDLSAFH